MKVLLCGIKEAKETAVDVFKELGFKVIDAEPEYTDYVADIKKTNDMEDKAWEEEGDYVTVNSTMDILVQLLLHTLCMDRDKLLEYFKEVLKHIDDYDVIFYCQPSSVADATGYMEAVRHSYVLIGWMATNIRPKKLVCISGNKEARQNMIKAHLRNPDKNKEDEV